MVDVQTVFIVALIAGGCTGLGALPIYFSGYISHRIYDGIIAFAAGVMTGASMFTLVIPGLEIEGALIADLFPFLGLGSMIDVVVGLALGGFFLLALDMHLHQFYPHFRDGNLDEYKKQALLIGGSITLHNFPEGLAIGIAFGSGMEEVALTLGLAIGIQNIPDGFSVAVPADKTELARWKNVLLTTLSGAIPEPIAAVIGFGLVQIVTETFPLAAGFAAGAMLAVVFKEMIPESHGHDYSTFATVMFISGFALMLIIDNVFAV